MNAFSKAFKHEHLGGIRQGGVSLLFLALAAVGKDDKHVGRLGFSNHTTGLNSSVELGPLLKDAKSRCLNLRDLSKFSISAQSRLCNQ